MKPFLIIFKILRRVYRVFKYVYDTTYTKILFSLNGVEYSSFNTSGIPVISLGGKGCRMKIGEGFRMNNGNSSNNIGYSNPCHFTILNDGQINVGDYVGMSQTAVCAVGANITIGHHTLLGGGVKLYSSDFHSLSWEDRQTVTQYRPAKNLLSEDVKNRKSSSITIGNNCFIGAGTIILKGVCIGDRTIIGAGSVVTKSFPSDSLVAGNPAVLIRSLNS